MSHHRIRTRAILFTSRRLAGLCLAGAIASTSMAALAAEPQPAPGSTLSGEEIRQQILGHRVQGSMSDGQQYNEAYGQDGVIVGDGYTGQASVQDDRLCLDYGSGDTTCYQVRLDDEQHVEWLENGDVVGDGVVSKTQTP
nr:hypothetical protein [uncultured Halomonas sp.]